MTTDRTGRPAPRATGGWQLDLDAARSYEAHLVPAIFDPMARRLVVLAGIEPGHRVLDVACGTGVVARTAARSVGPDRVIGVDCNPAMLEVARATADGIAFRRGDALDLPLDDDTVDVVTCQQALQFLPDPRAALHEMRRVAVPGGQVAVGVLRGLDANPVYAVFRDALGRHVGSAAAAMISSPFLFGDSQRLRSAAHEAGLDDVVVRIAVAEERFPSVAEFVAHEAASSPLSRELAALPPGPRAALVDDLESRLADHVDDVGLVFPNDTHVLTARA